VGAAFAAAGAAAMVVPRRRRFRARILGLPNGGDSGVPFLVLARWAARRWPGRDDVLERRLRAAGWTSVTAEDFRVAQMARAVVFGAAGLVLGAVALRSGLAALVLGGCGAVHAVFAARGRIERAQTKRTERMRLELATVDQLLAIHVRAGAGPMQAVRRVVERGRGEIVDELAAVLDAVRIGSSEAAAFRRAAEVTAEPHAARLYRLFATAVEHGADLADALRALSDDVRESRRDEMRRTATRRRAAMLLPTIGVLAPIILLFVAAPLPSMVLGSR
jgi:tight adherence protein C